MKTVYLIRDQIGRKQSLGSLMVKDSHSEIIFSCHALERGWLNNRRNVSCIPTGSYDLVLEYSHKFNAELWEIYGVQNRSECKIHSVNYWYQLNGCIAPGASRWDINNDGLPDVTSSMNTLKAFHAAMGADTRARIVVINDRVI